MSDPLTRDEWAVLFCETPVWVVDRGALSEPFQATAGRKPFCSFTWAIFLTIEAARIWRLRGIAKRATAEADRLLAVARAASAEADRVEATCREILPKDAATVATAAVS